MKCGVREWIGVLPSLDVCKNFPTKAEEIREFPGCTYWFDEEGKRQGYCCGCGACCIRVPWDRRICRFLEDD